MPPATKRGSLMNRMYVVVVLCAGALTAPASRAQVVAPPQQPLQPLPQPAAAAAPAAAVTAPPPATRPALAAATTQPALDELHRRAVELMRQGEWKKAVEPMARVYRALPPDQQPRAVILNQAILDVKLRTNAGRAVRDLTQYLSKHKAVDELAINVLGSALDVIADKTGMRKTALFQKGVAEWERRNIELEEGRPGSHRWGAEWLSDEDYAQLEKKRQEAKSRVADQQAVVDRAQWRFNVQFQTVRSWQSDATGHTSSSSGAYGPGGLLPDGLAENNSIGNVGGARTGGPLHDRNGNLIPNGGNVVGSGSADTSADDDWAEKAMARGQLRREVPALEAARNELAAEKAKLAELQEKSPKPYWPSEYPPLEPE